MFPILSIDINRQTALFLSSCLVFGEFFISSKKIEPEKRFYRMFDLTLSRKRGVNRAIFVSLVTYTSILCNGVSSDANDPPIYPVRRSLERLYWS